LSITKGQRRNSKSHRDMLAEHPPDEKASIEFHRKPYQSYTVTDYLRKMGVNVNKEVDAGGADDKGKTCNVPEQ
jgi:hypothetical protein